MFPIPIPEKEDGTLSLGIMLKYLKPEYIVKWSQKFVGRTYTTMANIYPVLVVQKVSYHEILILIQEYLLALDGGKIRIVYKHNNEDLPLYIASAKNKMPLPYLDVYLSQEL
jgi:hypothetical protein